MSVRISVVIATHERPGLLARCVRALLQQDLPRQAFEIVVVDDGSSDRAKRETMQAVRPCATSIRTSTAGRRRRATSAGAPRAHR
jgi:GT2 family glycosyltransferase